MGLTTPEWDTREYACLKQDLSGPLAFYEHEQLCARRKLLQRELDNLEHAGPYGEDLRRRIEESMVDLWRRVPRDKQSALGPLALQFRKWLRAGDRFNMDVVAAQIMQMFSKFDVAAFGAAFEDAVNADRPERMDELELEILGVDEHLDKWSRAKLDKRYFEHLPSNFHGQLLNGSQASRHSMAMRVLAKFQNDYLSRARFYLDPVTINGVMIRSLDGTRQEHWERLYTTLGLDKIQKSPRYVARRLTPQEQRLLTTGLPGMFTADTEVDE